MTGREVSEKEGKAFAEQNQMEFLEISCKEMKNIQELLELMGRVGIGGENSVKVDIGEDKKKEGGTCDIF